MCPFFAPAARRIGTTGVAPNGHSLETGKAWGATVRSAIAPPALEDPPQRLNRRAQRRRLDQALQIVHHLSLRAS
jgi:hypothetical protein